VLATLLELVGFALIVAAAYLLSLPLALFVAGVGLLAASRAADRPDAADDAAGGEGAR
jgi:hypothetical protein